MGKTKQNHFLPTSPMNGSVPEQNEGAGTGSFLPSPITNESIPKIESVWDVVGADNLHEIPVDDIVLKDKKALMLFTLFLKDEKDKIKTFLKQVNHNSYPTASQAVPPDEIPRISIQSSSPSFRSTLNNMNSIKLPPVTGWRLGERIKKEYKDYFEDPSCIYQNFAGGVAFNNDYILQDDQLDVFGIKDTKYSEYKLDHMYSVIPINDQIAQTHDFFYLCPHLESYIDSIVNLTRGGFPYRTLDNGRYPGFPIFESRSFKTSFFFRGRKPQESMLVVKYYSREYSYKGKVRYTLLRKHYLPVIFFRDINNISDVYSVFAGMPKSPARHGGYLPLYNSFGLKRIEKSKTVVLCESLEDADAMQRYDENNKTTAYVSFVCDPGRFDQVDFSPLRGKKVEFLISNHSGKEIEDIRRSVKDLYYYLNVQKRSRITSFAFRERIVRYPVGNQIPFDDYCNLFSMQRPSVVEKRVYNESEFNDLFAGGFYYANIANNASTAKTTNSNQEESGRPHPGRPRHQNLTAEKTILRPFIRRGCTTVLTGDPGIGKSRFAIALAAQVAGSKNEFLKDRLWTRCMPPRGEKNGFKVVYWVFDDVDKDDISLQRKFFACGLSKDQEKNLFIEPGRSISRRDCESLKEELKRYSSRGMQNHPVDFLIIDTLLSFAGSPAKIFSAFEELVRLKDEMPSLAILVIHHNSKEGNPFGGVLATNMPRVIIEMKRDNTDVTDDLEDPITVNIIKHSNEHFGIDIVPFEIKLDTDHFVITNNSDLPQETIKKLVIYEYKSNRLEQFSSTDIGRLLGVPRHRIENAWNKEVEEEAKALWSIIRLKLKEKAKALNEASSRKKGSSKDDGQPEDDVQHQPQKEKRPSRKASSPHANTSARQGNRNKG